MDDYEDRALPIEGAKLVRLCFRGNPKDSEVAIEVEGAREVVVPLSGAEIDVGFSGAGAAVRTRGWGDTVVMLEIVPLPLAGGELVDLRSGYEQYRSPDPYAPLWRKLTAKPRGWFEMDPIAWGAFPGLDADENPTCDAAELAEVGDREGARELLMEVLGTDLRCIDAHAHLGHLEFDRSPEQALIHYEIGIRIGELSLPADFDGVLVWGRIYNRPFLRCLHGYGLCLWRLGRLAEARRVFERILSLNPNDNQGVRWCWDDVRHGRSWEEMQAREDAARAEPRRDLH